jgi:hypothetical protein
LTIEINGASDISTSAKRREGDLEIITSKPNASSTNPTFKVFDLPQIAVGCYSFTQHALRVRRPSIERTQRTDEETLMFKTLMFIGEPMSIARTHPGRGNQTTTHWGRPRPVQYLQQPRLTKSRKVSAKYCAQFVANRDSEHGYAFAIAGYALLLEPLLPFLSPTHCGRRPYWPLLAATLAQRAHSGLLLGPQKHQRSALSLAVRPLAQPRVHLGRFLGPQEHRRSALSLSVKSAVRWIVL